MAKIKNPLSVVQSGGGWDDIQKYNKNLSNDSFRNVNMDGGDFVLRIDNLQSRAIYPLYGMYNFNTLTIRSDGQKTILPPLYGVGKFSTLYPESTIIIDMDTSLVTSYSNFFRDIKIDTVQGIIDFTSATDISCLFYGDCRLKNATFKENSLKLSDNYIMSNNYLTDASIISFVNALNESVTGESLRVDSNVRTRILAILGTVSLDSTNTYHIFTEDASGTVTLADFITNTKGWTLA